MHLSMFLSLIARRPLVGIEAVMRAVAVGPGNILLASKTAPGECSSLLFSSRASHSVFAQYPSGIRVRLYTRQQLTA